MIEVKLSSAQFGTLRKGLVRGILWYVNSIRRCSKGNLPKDGYRDLVVYWKKQIRESRKLLKVLDTQS